jgi:hypothetical protein
MSASAAIIGISESSNIIMGMAAKIENIWQRSGIENEIGEKRECRHDHRRISISNNGVMALNKKQAANKHGIAKIISYQRIAQSMKTALASSALWRKKASEMKAWRSNGMWHQ